MNLDDQIRRYFGTDQITAIAPGALTAGLDHLRVDLALETDRSRKFALWALMYMLGAGPDLETVFKDAADREAARDFMDLSDLSG
jgi:hypothetical protein